MRQLLKRFAVSDTVCQVFLLNSSIRGKVTYSTSFGGKDVQGKREQDVDYIPKRNVLLNNN